MNRTGYDKSRRGTWTAFVAVTLCSGLAAPADETGFQALDLKPIVNMDWRDEIWGDGKGGWTDQGDNDLREIRVGRSQLLGIPFELIDPAGNHGKAVLTLGSKKFPTGPTDATAEFHGTARCLYFLHAAAWSSGHMGNYVIHYVDGTTVEIPIRDKEEIMNWWYPDATVPKYRAAIHVPNSQTDDVGLVVFGWDNPHPDKVIRSVEFQSLQSDGIVVVAAVTASDQPVRLPAPQDIPTPEYLQSDLETLDRSQWFPVEVVEDPFEPTPIDQSASLDAPAGKHGFLKTVDGRWEFEDGTPARFVATMQGTPQDKRESAYVARWLAKYGFNLVRIGHLVTGPEKNSAVDWSRPDSGHLNPEVMDQLDYFIAELAKQGIYSRPSLLWYRKLKKGDGVDAFDESVAFADQKATGKRQPGEEPVLDSVGITFFDEQGHAGQHRPGKGDPDAPQSLSRQPGVRRGPGHLPDRSNQRRRRVLLHHRRHRAALRQAARPALGRLAAEETRLAGEAGGGLGRRSDDAASGWPTAPSSGSASGS